MSAQLSSAQSVALTAGHLDYAQDDEFRPLPFIVTFPFIAASSAGLWFLLYKVVRAAASFLG